MLIYAFPLQFVAYFDVKLPLTSFHSNENMCILSFLVIYGLTNQKIDGRRKLIATRFQQISKFDFQTILGSKNFRNFFVPKKCVAFFAINIT